MATYSVVLPISGIVCVEVEADSEEEAVSAALESDFSRDDIEDWEVHRHLVRGNVCYATQHEAAATQVTAD